MRVRFYTGDKPVSLDELLRPFIEARGGLVSVEELCQYLLGLLEHGRVTMDPSASTLVRIVLQGVVLEWTRQAQLHGGRRFLSDRARGRLDRSVARAWQACERQRELFIESIRRTLFVEGPAMYRSQARLLALLDPTVDGETLAAQCASLVSQAVREGVEAAQHEREAVPAA